MSGIFGLSECRSINMLGRALRLLTNFLTVRSKTSRATPRELTGHWRQMCRTFSRFSFSQGDALKKGAARYRLLMDGFIDGAAVVDKEIDDFDPPSGLGSIHSDATAGPSSSDASDAGVVVCECLVD